MLRKIYRPRLADFASDRAFVIQTFLGGVFITLMYRPFVQPELGDQSIWDYIAQAVLRGQIPYRDVIEIKTPLSAYLSALAIAFFRWFGAPDVIAIRLLYVLLVGAIAATTYSVAKIYLQNRWVGILAVLTMLMSDHFISWMFSGTEPKMCMILFGLFTLLLIAKNQPFLAGVCSMLSFLCWQPGLLFTGAAALVFSNYLTRWRDGRALKVLAGASLLLVIALIYFYAHGALDDFWKWTIVYTYKVYAPMTHKEDATIHVWAIFYRVFRYEIVLPVLSAIGLGIFIKDRVTARYNSQGVSLGQNIYSDALWIPPLVYLLFCFINLQAGPDLIPIFPFVGIFAGFGLLKLSEQLGQKLLNRQHLILEGLPKFAALVMLIVALGRGFTFFHEKGSPLAEQIKSLEPVKQQLNGDEKIYTHGATEVLVLLNRPNANPAVFLDFGKDDFIASQSQDGFSRFFAELESQKPKVVILARLKKVTHKDDLREWAETHYNKFAVVGYDEAYVRRPDH